MDDLLLCERRAPTACSISLGGEGNALYPVLSSYICYFSCYLNFTEMQKLDA